MQYIFNDGIMKCRLIRQAEDWYVAEYKLVNDDDGPWIPCFCGTSDFMALTEQEKSWARSK